ncbi:MAG: hypothetical protein ACLRMN_04810 [Mediterraneibacter gnavus]
MEEMAQGEPLFEFRLRYTGADSMELERLKADIAAFLSANDVSEDQIFTVPTISICRALSPA